MTIKDVTVDVLEGHDGSREEKEVVWFEETSQGLVLNKVNTTTIVEITGTDDSDEMTGHRVVLFQSRTDMCGRQVDCIRVRAPKAGSKATEPPPSVTEDKPDDIPF